MGRSPDPGRRDGAGEEWEGQGCLPAQPRRVLGSQPTAGPLPQFLGRWFSVGLASNASWFLEKKAVLSTCKTMVVPTEDSDLNLTSTFLRKNQCETRTMLLRRAGTPGSYSYRSPHWGSTYSVSVVETNYEEYALLFTQGAKGPGQEFRMAALYSRALAPLKAELQEKFSAFCKSQGFTEDSIVFLPQTDKCMKQQE